MLEPAQMPVDLLQAFHLMLSDRPGPVLIDLPIDVQLAAIEFDIDTYEPRPVYNPAAARRQAEKAIAMLDAAERPLFVSGGGVINAEGALTLDPGVMNRILNSRAEKGLPAPQRELPAGLDKTKKGKLNNTDTSRAAGSGTNKRSTH